ncbi:MAG: YceH family protein [bacterium]
MTTPNAGPLDAAAVRVLGALVEKEATTPDNYPLTLNALVAACNQTSNREPVMALEEDAVSRTIEDLRRRSLVRAVQRSDSRTMRYRHLLTETMSLEGPELAALSVLMLRGAQTTGEVKTRAGRLYDFRDLAQVEAAMDALAARQPSPLATRLPRRPGQKEARYAHLLSGEPAMDSEEHAPPTPSHDGNRLDELQAAVDGLRAELAMLRATFEEFRKEFQ